MIYTDIGVPLSWNSFITANHIILIFIHQRHSIARKNKRKNRKRLRFNCSGVTLVKHPDMWAPITINCDCDLFCSFVKTVLPSSRSSWDVLGALLAPSKDRAEQNQKSGKKNDTCVNVTFIKLHSDQSQSSNFEKTFVCSLMLAAILLTAVACPGRSGSRGCCSR
jgi:hypothetical protein